MKIEKFPEYILDGYIKEKLIHEDMFINIEYQNNTSVVLGRVTPHTSDVNSENCKTDNISIFRRKGGGGAVLLFPGVTIISCSFKKDHRVVDLMKCLDVAVEKIKEGILNYIQIPLEIRGNGDLCIEDKKILGSSIYSTKEYITYYCTLIIRGNINSISKYLTHPSKEPDYRKGRSHENFITTIEANAKINNDNELFTSIRKSLETIKIKDIYLD
ncbi:MAG: hypothetical protein PHQ32_07510 [Firmicutes bacterium]|nr:hypothetical protein [Bacillota bacterium]